MREEHYPMTPRERVVPQLLEKAVFARRVERVAATEAVGRILAEPVVARNTLPNAPTARLDGIACRFADVVRVAGGRPGEGALEEGIDFAFCNTGTMVPAAYDTVVRIEDVEPCGDGCYRLTALPAAPGELVNPVGSLMRAGDVLLERLHQVCPQDVGRLVAAGVDEVAVVQAPVVGFVPTGDELVPAGTEPPLGMNVESNGAMIAAYVAAWGGVARVWPVQPDDPATIEAALREAAAACDIVVVNAGSSKGGRDYTVEVLGRLGEVLTYKVDHGPGHHTTAAITPEGRPILGLVGPPGGAAVTAELYLLPLIDAFLQRETLGAVKARAVLREPLRVRQTIDFYQPVHIDEGDGVLVASACEVGRPRRRDGIVKISRGTGKNGVLGAGASVEVLLDEPRRWASWL